MNRAHIDRYTGKAQEDCWQFLWSKDMAGEWLTNLSMTNLTPICSLPVLFWSQFFALICSIGATYASNYAGFTACRTLQGFFGAPPQVIGLSMIHDMFFFHERARKINIWAFSFLIGPYLGPFISGFIVSKLDWRNTFGILCGFYGLSVLMIILFGDETLYDRESYGQDGHVQQPAKKGFVMERILKLTGVHGIRVRKAHPPFWEVSKDLFGLLRRPHLLLPSKFITKSHAWHKSLTFTSIRLCYMDNNVDNRHCLHDHPIRQTTTVSLLRHGRRPFILFANDWHSPG